ncbi:sensor histidine kinase [Planomonospora sp. ID67723]|uniref:sensor histidine kinase n=1 Tax=Planomonospora sp. ID67723 TaxID=2738134 RepID=UPI0018C3AC74|nr:sensor histidine kinase [Planomonospora sp. ID67723]MBG0827098.1 sensor histidine kinase [Planomonospora sp. ID67723]
MSRIMSVPVLRVPAADAAIGLGLAVLVLAAGVTGLGPLGPAGSLDVGAIVLAGAAAGVLSARRSAPFPVLLAANAITAAWYFLDYPGRLITLAVLIGCYTLAAEHGRWWGLAGWGITAAVSTVVVHTAFDVRWFDDRAVNALSLEIVAVALGASVHYHRAAAVSARERAEQAAEIRAGQARARAAEQRLEIARELHDVLGHTMATISVQAGVAVHLMNRHPGQAANALTTIKTISDEGLAEVQILLGALRADGGTPSHGGLAHMDRLLDVTRATGTPVELTVRGERRPLPTPVDLAAFRIVQESLTNVRRHARATSVQVKLDYGEDMLEIVVRNDGVTDAGPPTPVGGNGIGGMRARAAALGGTLSADARPDGTFEVRCSLPVDGSP